MIKLRRIEECHNFPSFICFLDNLVGFSRGSVSKESTCNAGDMGLIPELGRSPGEGNGNPLQYSCLGNSMDRGTWQATVHRVTKVGLELATKLPSILIYSEEINSMQVCSQNNQIMILGHSSQILEG